MSREIALSRKLGVVKLYFEGLPYDDIAEKTGVAKGSVAAIVEALRAGEFPRFEQATDLVNELRDLAVGLRKAGLVITEASLLFVLSKRLISLGVEPGHLEAWVKMCEALPEGELPRSAIIQAATKLTKLEQEGINYEEAIERLESSSAKVKELEAKLMVLRTDVARLESKKEELLQAKHNLEAENTRLQGSLNAIAVKAKEAEKRVSDYAKKARQHQEAVNRLEASERELTKIISGLEEKAQTLRKEVDDTRGVLGGLEEVGFTRKDWRN